MDVVVCVSIVCVSTLYCSRKYVVYKLVLSLARVFPINFSPRTGFLYWVFPGEFGHNSLKCKDYNIQLVRVTILSHLVTQVFSNLGVT